MKNKSLLHFFRTQKKFVQLMIVSVCWAQVYGQSYVIYENKKEQDYAKIRAIQYFASRVTDMSIPENDNSGNLQKNEVKNHRRKDRVQETITSKKSLKTIHFPSSSFKKSKSTGSTIKRIYYPADIQGGTIGVNGTKNYDYVEDNVFHIQIDQLNPSKYYQLEYDLYGVADGQQITKTVNDGLANQTTKVELTTSWTSQKEPLQIHHIKKGKNTIVFTIPKKASYAYQVKNVRITINDKASTAIPRVLRETTSVSKNVLLGQSADLTIATAELHISENSLKKKQNFQIIPLSEVDIPALSPEMVNVTSGNQGYRFLPHGEHFNTPAQVSLGYDVTKLPPGYTEQDIKTFFFDKIQKKWIALEKDSLVTENKMLISKTTHFTDMVNGVIKVPESPETGAYTPNAIQDIKAADPSAGIVNISPPNPNNKGTVNTSFPIKLPAGRNGMQPSLSVDYNSEGGNGWMGLGWNLSFPSIGIDSRWGVPRYDSNYESEIYTVGGEQLTFRVGEQYVLPNKKEGFHQSRTSERQFFPRVEGAYQKIIRHGSNPTNYWWEVISKNGTRSFYGGNGTTVVDNAVLKQPNTGNIGHWALYRVVDTYGNYIQYDYDKTIYNPSSNLLGKGGQEMYPKKITYTLHQNDTTLKKYTVLLNQEISDSRKDIQVDARLGFVKVTSKRLKNIQVKYDGNLIRSYQFEYQEGAFSKTLLSSITEKDANGADFYTHRMAYNQLPEQVFGPEKEMNAIADDLSDDTSILGSSKSKSNTFGGVLNIGIAKKTDLETNNPFWKYLSSAAVGIDYQSSSSKSYGKTNLIDVDADGLPDKIFTSSTGEATPFQYRKNINAQSFNTSIKTADNSTLFSFEKSKSNSVGGQFTLKGTGILSGGSSYSNTINTTKTYNYWTDANSDGIMDLVDNGNIKFGYVDNGIIKYTNDVQLTPNPLFSSTENISVSNEPSCAEIKEAYKNHPLQDVVQVWKAPFSGTVKITGYVKLVNPAESTDGVRFFFQKGNQYANADAPFVLITDNIHTLNEQIQVQRGDYLYFRVNVINESIGDEVEMPISIDYQTGAYAVTQKLREHSGRLIGHFENTKVISSSGWFKPAISSASGGTISGTFTKPITEGEMSFRIQRRRLNPSNNQYTYTNIHAQGYDNLEEVSFDFSYSTGAITENDEYRVVYSTSTNEKLEELEPLVFQNLKLTTADGIFYRMLPYYMFYKLNNWELNLNNATFYDKFTLPTSITNNISTQKAYLVVDNTFVQNIDPSFIGNHITAIVYRRATGTNNDYQKVYKQDILLTDISDPLLGNTNTYRLYYTFTADYDYYVETYDAEKNRITSIKITNGINTVTHNVNYYTLDTDTIMAGNNPHTDDGRFGIMYQNWGQFIYHGGYGEIPNTCPNIVNELPNYGTLGIDPSVLIPQNENTTVTTIGDIRFQMMNPIEGNLDPDNTAIVRRYTGMAIDNYAEGKFVKPIRLGAETMDDVVASVSFSSNGGTFNAPIRMTKSVANNASSSISASIAGLNGTISNNTTETILDYQDLNGDGYPDVVLSDNTPVFTNMLGGLTTEDNVSPLSPSTTKSSGTGLGVSQNYAIPFKSNGDNTSKAAAAASAGANVSGGAYNSTDESTISYMDYNGDGLPDKVSRSSSKTWVALNLGYSFASPVEILPLSDGYRTGKTNSGNFGLGGGFSDFPLGKSIANGSISFGYGNSQNTSEQTIIPVDINGDGLMDKVKGNTIFINTGNTLIPLSNGFNLNNATEKSNGYGYNLNFAITGSVLIPLSDPNKSLKISLNPSYSKGEGKSNTLMKFMDVNGDGYQDIVYSKPNGTYTNDKLYYRPSQIGVTNRLKKVTLPMGGSWEVEYRRMGNTYDMPQNKYVYCVLKTHDGFSQDETFKPNTIKKTMAYGSGYYNRRERTFYGFSHISIYDYDVDGNKYRKLTKKYINTSYYRRGFLYYDILQDVNNYNVWSYNRYDSNARSIHSTNTVVSLPTKEEEKTMTSYAYFVPTLRTVNYFYDGTSNSYLGYGKYTHDDKTTFDEYGNVVYYQTIGDIQIGSSDKIKTYITYQSANSGSTYYSQPIQVKSVATGVVRERKATYNAQRSLAQIKITDGSSTPPTYDFEYDTYGNIQKSTGPKNNNGERFFHTYTYDDKVKTYPTKVEDAFGYRSKTTYDYRFGLPLFTEDMNLQPMKYQYDSFGRATHITGPYEMFNNVPWTIRFHYAPITNAPLNATNAQSYAKTEHYDPEHPGSYITTISISDGLASPIQVKKIGVIYNNGSETQQYIVSGKVKQDAFGRAIASYYPTTEAIGNTNTLYNPAVDDVTPTISTYDVLDRVLSTQLPGEDLISTVKYDFGNDVQGRKMFRTTFTDELGSVKIKYSDIKGRTTSVWEVSTTGDIKTQFTHNALGDILQVKDVAGNITSSAYDMLGRRTKYSHPDSGTTLYEYDDASNLINKNNAEDQLVKYEYDYNRLKEVVYPIYPENNVKYYYGEANNAAAMDNNAVGRLWYQTDATGSQYLKYGKLGELTYQRRAVVVPGNDTYWFETKWEYDTWNRVKQITYPDGEQVDYFYNKAGNLAKMQSKKDAFTQQLINNIGYDKFEQRVYLEYGNGTKTTYEYETERRRLLKLNAKTAANRDFQKNVYQYDAVSNVLQVQNNAPFSQNGLLGGGTTYAYTYDDLYRLTTASGSWRGQNSQSQEERQRYTVSMAYDNMHNVTRKEQKHERAMGATGNDWLNVSATSYRLNYKYEDTNHPHAPSTIVDEPNVEGTLCCDEDNPEVKFQHYQYDKKGNPLDIKQQTCTYTEERTSYVWDEENRLRFVDTNPSTPAVDGAALYTYDAGGERVIKDILYGAEIKNYNHLQEVLVNEPVKHDATIYPSGLLSMKLHFGTNDNYENTKIRYTKHYYAGSQRIASKLGNANNIGKFNCHWLIIPFSAGALPFNQNAGYNGSCVNDYPLANAEKDVYWYHPDHLGSSSFVTNLDGEVNQNIEYFPSGEVFVENHRKSYNTPYKFNAKELDNETGYYYYGARYYNPRTSIWLNVDPLADYNPFYNSEHYIDGQHNGGVYNTGNLNPYIYTYQNPIKYVDPNGKQALAGAIMGAFTEYLSIVGSRMIFEDMSFKEASYDNWTWKDTGNVTISFGIGFVSGTAKFTKFMSGSVGRKIMKEIAVAGIENFMKLGVEMLVDERGMTKEDAEKLIVGTLADYGLGKLLPAPAKKNLENADKAVKYYKNPKYWKAKEAANTKKAAQALNTTGKVVNETASKIGSNKAQKEVENNNKKRR